MKVCVVGAGAIGGYMAVHIANAGHEVSVIARGPHLAAIKDKGLKLIEAETEFVADKLVATNDIKELGSVDVVLLALKAHQIFTIVTDYIYSICSIQKIRSSKYIKWKTFCIILNN